MDYSKVVWAALSDDERVMMLDRYTIDMTAGPVYGLDANGEADLQYTGYFSNPNHVENPSHE